jgi:hypothetical protein
MVWALLLAVLMPAVSLGQAELEADPPVVIREVKEDPAFKVHKVTDRVPKPMKLPSWLDWLKFMRFGGGGGAAQILGNIFIVSVCGLLVGLIVWLVWINRHAFIFRRIGRLETVISPSARVVMGMQVSPETLPADVPAAAWELWRQDRHQEALGLLYRGSISRVIELARVEIQESDTEGDCVRRVDLAGAAAHPDYFRGITGAWIHLAYGGRRPADVDVEALCRQWPFAERRAG